MIPPRLPHLCPVLIAAAIAVVAPPAVAQTGCLTAECVPPPNRESPPRFTPGRIFGGFYNGNYIPGQTFTPRFRGVLKEVRLGLQNASDPDDATPVTAEIRTVAAEFPTTVILAQAPVSGAPYVGGNLYPASFASQHVVLEPGTRYAVTLRGGGPNIVYILAAFPGCPPSTGSNDPVHSYDGGLTWSYAWFPAERSFVYEVCVEAAKWKQWRSIEEANSAVRGTWGRLKTIYR